MRVKEFNNKIAHISCSPASIYPNFIATATAAEQVDSSSSSKPSLDLLKIDLSDPRGDLEVAASVQTETRFLKLVWSEYSSSNSNNLIIGGGENSKIYLYDYEKLLSGRGVTQDLVYSLEKHDGNVYSLDVNPFQHNLLASGASSSEILIWDLNNPSTPMTPGAKLQPLDDVNCLSWNNQVQHILASTSSGKCVVWDLRKNESIIKVSDSMSKIKAKLVGWNPEVATQMCLSSDDDNSPSLQIWDLRFATSPVRLLEGHHRGVLAFNWFTSDSNLLISSSKDNRIICWNPNNPTVNGEILYEVPTVGQWCFDLSWSKRSPNLVAAASFEGQINVFSLMGGRYNVTQPTSSKIMDSFGVDNTTLPPATNSQLGQNTTQVIDQLKIAPKWMKRPCGASFGFGGKLVTFGKFSTEAQHAPQVGGDAHQISPPVHDAQASGRIHVHQVITDSKLVENSYHLENALLTGNLIEYCNYKIESVSSADENANQTQSFIWKFILATFDQNKAERYLELLGFDRAKLEAKLNSTLKEISDEKHHNQHQNHQNNLDQVNRSFNSALNFNGLSNSTATASNSMFDNIETNNSDQQTDDTFNDIARSLSPVNLSFKNDIDNLISELLLLGRYENVVDLCIQEERFTDAILIANFFDKNLFLKAQQAYFRHNNKNKFSNLLEKFLNRNWTSIVSTCSLKDWKEALASVITYTHDDEQMQLLDTLGSRLEQEGSLNNLLNACICYICSTNLDNLVQCWQKVIGLSGTQEDASTSDSSANLQDLIEKVMILRFYLVHYNVNNPQQAAAKKLNQNQTFKKLNSKLIQYARLLADQGCFLNAYNYIKDSNDPSLAIIKDRLYHVIDPQVIQQYKLPKPECPFRQTQQSVQAKSNIAAQNTRAQNMYSNSMPAALKNTYHSVTDPSLAGRPQMTTPYSNATANQLNTPFMPVNSVNHPMPTSALYASQANRSITPVSQVKPPTMPPLPTATVAPQPTATSNFSAPNAAGSFYTPQASNTPTPPTLNQSTIPSYMHTKPTTAWNDPPMIVPKIKPVQPVKEAEVPTFFQPSMPTAPQLNQSLYNPQSINAGMYYQSSQNQPPMPGFNSQIGQMNAGYDQQQQHQQQQQQQQPNAYVQKPFIPSNQPTPQPAVHQSPDKAPTPIEKGPLPAEHQIIQTVFDNLLNKCLHSTNAPTVKRKLEDVGKKLEILYDKLRDSTLSPSVTQGLHMIVQYMQAYDYQSCLNLHSNLVATSNFTEISGFMPGIKVLIQSCQQMNVTL